MRFRIRKASIEDKETILEILNHYNMGDFGHSEREEMPKLENFILACDGDRAVGCAAFLLNDQSKLTINHQQAETGSLAVIPEYRGKGVGAQLQIARMLRLVELGVKTLFTETDTEANIRWYCRKFNYRVLHTRNKTDDFGDSSVPTFTLLETDLEKWYNAHQARKALEMIQGFELSWYEDEGFGELADVATGSNLSLIHI